MPPATKCPAEAELADFVTGRLRAGAAAAAEAHVLACARCQAALDRLAPADELLTALRGPDAAESAVEPGTVEEMIRRLTRGQGGDAAPPAGHAEAWRVGAYRVGELLGEGGMGRVYRAVDETLCRPVAIKMMRPGVAARPEARELFLREARAVAALHDDHIVAIHHVGEAADPGGGGAVPILVMPLLRGECLEEYARRAGPLSEPEVRVIGRQVARALAAAHAAGVVHRDIKPTNVWLETAGGPPAPGNYRVKVLDFGLALSGGPARDAGAVMGTPGYMAPEQAGGAGRAGRPPLA